MAKFTLAVQVRAYFNVEVQEKSAKKADALYYNGYRETIEKALIEALKKGGYKVYDCESEVVDIFDSKNNPTDVQLISEKGNH